MFKSHYFSCILWLTVAFIVIAVQAGPVDENEIKKGRDCKTFCDKCGCIGFYCGEECICECNQDRNGGDTKCIDNIQSKAKENKTPYEILIQGPSANRFLKNALQFEQNEQTCNPMEYGRSKRSTVVIYKPVTDESNVNGFCERPVAKKDEMTLKQTFRAKRAIGESWFTDFSNTLVKPAPIAGMPVDAEDTEDIEEVVEEEPELEQEADEETTKPVNNESNDSFIPKIRELKKDFKTAFNINDNDSFMRGIRKTFTKLGDKALKAVELDGAVKKFRGTISNFLTPEEADQANVVASRKILNKIKGKILQPFGDDEELES